MRGSMFCLQLSKDTTRITLVMESPLGGIDAEFKLSDDQVLLAKWLFPQEIDSVVECLMYTKEQDVMGIDGIEGSKSCFGRDR